VNEDIAAPGQDAERGECLSKEWEFGEPGIPGTIDIDPAWMNPKPTTKIEAQMTVVGLHLLSRIAERSTGSEAQSGIIVTCKDPLVHLGSRRTSSATEVSSFSNVKEIASKV